MPVTDPTQKQLDVETFKTLAGIPDENEDYDDNIEMAIDIFSEATRILLFYRIMCHFESAFPELAGAVKSYAIGGTSETFAEAGESYCDKYYRELPGAFGLSRAERAGQD
jgi:hypothetical protein